MRYTSVDCSRVRAMCRSGEARRLRQSAGVSLSEAASDCHVTPPTIQRWETGRRSPRADHALVYGAFLRRLQQLEDERTREAS